MWGKTVAKCDVNGIFQPLFDLLQLTKNKIFNRRPGFEKDLHVTKLGKHTTHTVGEKKSAST